MDNYYGFDMFDRGIKDDEVSMLFCADNSVAPAHALAQGTSSSTYGDRERGISTTACVNNIAFISKVDAYAYADNVSTLSCDVSALTTSVNETARALKELTERVNKMDCVSGDRLKRSDLRTLRVG